MIELFLGYMMHFQIIIHRYFFILLHKFIPVLFFGIHDNNFMNWTCLFLNHSQKFQKLLPGFIYRNHQINHIFSPVNNQIRPGTSIRAFLANILIQIFACFCINSITICLHTICYLIIFFSKEEFM